MMLASGALLSSFQPALQKAQASADRQGIETKTEQESW